MTVLPQSGLEVRLRGLPPPERSQPTRARVLRLWPHSARLATRFTRVRYVPWLVIMRYSPITDLPCLCASRIWRCRSRADGGLLSQSRTTIVTSQMSQSSSSKRDEQDGEVAFAVSPHVRIGAHLPLAKAKSPRGVCVCHFRLPQFPLTYSRLCSALSCPFDAGETPSTPARAPMGRLPSWTAGVNASSRSAVRASIFRVACL